MKSTEVCILGGGLAGLTLALQLKHARPDTDIVVLERRKGPAPDAGFKVGESTVEIGAHYFCKNLNLASHLHEDQIRKFGFRFFFNDGSDRIDQCTEVGVSMLLPTASWQLDRGRFENSLMAHAEAAGVRVVMDAVVKKVELDEQGGLHGVEYEQGGARETLASRWVVDAAGRANILKRKLSLAKPNAHDVNAVWARVEGCVDPNTWTDNEAWLDRCTPRERWRSTNHLCGEGYWLWLIPLSSNAHSIGIVADQAIHPLEQMNTHEKFMQWLSVHQPQLHADLCKPEHALIDFKFMRHFSHDCKQVFSKHRWALTGESGVFPDPFYSPGSDFIAISNTYITDLICKDLSGHAIDMHADIYQQLLFSFHENTMTLYQDQYALFGNAMVMPVKVVWDYTYYWALLAPLYISGRIAHLSVLARLRGPMEAASRLNLLMQTVLRAWHHASQFGAPEDGRLLDQYKIDWFKEMNRSLTDVMTDAEFIARIESNINTLTRLAAEIAGVIRARNPEVDLSALDAMFAKAEAPAAAPMLGAVWYASA